MGNVQMIGECENVQMCEWLNNVLIVQRKHINTSTHFPNIRTFPKHLHICTFSHLHIPQAFAHLHIYTFTHSHISHLMQLYGLLGYPLGHSFSARYFADKFEREHIDAEYRNFEFDNIEKAMQHLMAQPNLIGFNVTIPYKQAVMPYLTSLSPEAEAIGAVNVVCAQHTDHGKLVLHGCNSDVIGFSDSIRPLLRPEVHKRALVLGTGGASKAVMHGLKQMGIEPTYVSRTATLGRLTYEQLTPEVMNDYKVIVNCSPVGMYPKVDTCPAIPYELLTPDHLLYDLVYNPLETLFMKRGAAQGAVVKNGLEMLHLQADAAWQMWHTN